MRRPTVDRLPWHKVHTGTILKIGSLHHATTYLHCYHIGRLFIAGNPDSYLLHSNTWHATSVSPVNSVHHIKRTLSHTSKSRTFSLVSLESPVNSVHHMKRTLSHTSESRTFERFRIQANLAESTPEISNSGVLAVSSLVKMRVSSTSNKCYSTPHKRAFPEVACSTLFFLTTVPLSKLSDATIPTKSRRNHCDNRPAYKRHLMEAIILISIGISSISFLHLH